MNKLTLMMLTVWTIVSCAVSFGDKPAITSSPYEVVWDSPSLDYNGTVPLGNGEVALNAWIEPSGDLRFYIARTDCWDDSGRLLKVGSVRIKIGDGSADRTKTFRQALTVKDGTLSARYGEGDAQVDLRLWVDANRPVICVEAQTVKPSAATAVIELWRNAVMELPEKACSDVLSGLPKKTVVEPDTVLGGIKDRIGWYHRNIKSVGPAMCARIQGVADFPRPDPLLHRTFGALIAAERPERVDDRTLRSVAGTRHIFEIAVCAKHPATAEEWQAMTQKALDEARAVPLAQRRAEHERWWADFWNRSWIHIAQNGAPVNSVQGQGGAVPTNAHPLRIGMDQGGGSRFNGTFGRFGVYTNALSDTDVQALAATAPDAAAPTHPARVYSAIPEGPKVLPELTDHRTFKNGITIEAWIKPFASGSMRIADKITPGGSDGFLFDTHPGLDVRLIVGGRAWHKEAAFTTGTWQHTAFTLAPDGRATVYINGKVVILDGSIQERREERDDAVAVSRAYALQRYVSACAGRGRYPIKFNGSLFTVPIAGNPEDADYRRWGPGYWWQNTRLPYYSMCASGDYEMMQPLFNMYARDLMPFFKFRTHKYLGHGGAYIPECIYFWGDMFTKTYGTQPFEERTDKLQASGWHKWEWVSGLELAGLMLDYYDHSQDNKFLREDAIPAIQEILVFFDQQYKTGDDGKLYMHPAQACETWWDCVNPMPELAGLYATTARLQALPESLTTAEDRMFWKQLQAKLPALPTTQTSEGKVMLAPAQVFKRKQNNENPELYGVFPFRQIAVGKPNLEWGVEALKHRLDKGCGGWRQDDIFMAWLGQTAQAREYVVNRARSKHGASRFPAFWGPNYDWVPDQGHGSVLLVAVQSLLLQTDGREIYLLPAWPRDWDCEFRLHAPYQTVIEGKVVGGKITELKVTPESRRKDVKIMQSGS